MSTGKNLRAWADRTSVKVFMPSREYCSTTCRQIGGWGLLTAVGIGFVAWSSTHVYMCFCAPQGSWGFVQSLIVMDSSFCQILMSLMIHMQSMYKAMLVAFLFGIVGSLTKIANWMSSEEMDIPTEIQGPVLRRRKITSG
jgi:hypothetical protein